MTETTENPEITEAPKHRLILPDPRPRFLADYLTAMIERDRRNAEVMEKLAPMRKTPRADSCE